MTTYNVSQVIAGILAGDQTNTLTIRKVADMVSEQCKIARVPAQNLVSMYVNDPQNGFYIQKGPNGGIKRGVKPSYTKSHRDGACGLCGQKPREARAKAMVELLSQEKWAHVTKFLEENQEFRDELSYLAEKYSKEN